MAGSMLMYGPRARKTLGPYNLPKSPRFKTFRWPNESVVIFKSSFSSGVKVGTVGIIERWHHFGLKCEVRISNKKTVILVWFDDLELLIAPTPDTTTEE